MPAQKGIEMIRTKINGVWVDGLISTGKPTTVEELASSIYHAGDARSMKEAREKALDQLEDLNRRDDE